MFESRGDVVEELDRLVGDLARAGADVVDDTTRVDVLEALERVKAACAAAQVRVTVDLVESQAEVARQWREHARWASEAGDFEGWRRARALSRAASCPEADEGDSDVAAGRAGADGRGRRVRRSGADLGVAAQVALARRESPHTGGLLVRLAFALTHEMPFVLGLLERGLISERRALVVVRECATLTGEQRTRVDAELGHALGEGLGRLGDRELADRVRAVGYRLDPDAVVDRAAYAAGERRVSLRPAPDAMCWLTALLPAAQGVAVLAALTRAADTARAQGDPRGRGQVMADLLVERATGLAAAATGDAGSTVPVEVQLVMTDRALLTDAATPAVLRGYGPVPADHARALLRPVGEETATQAWVRRLYTDPVDGTLVAMESRRRTFDGPLRQLLLARDSDRCRTPGCDAPIRHLDHVTPHAAGGPTTAANGQGLCVRCNLVKEQPGWTARPLPPPGHRTGAVARTVTLTTPTGHTYHSPVPPLLTDDPGLPDSPLERALERLAA